MKYRKIQLYLGFIVFLAFASISMPSCSSTKEGCPINEQAGKGNVNKKGELTNKRGKSNLFPKKMR
jgi:hypothetical protein